MKKRKTAYQRKKKTHFIIHHQKSVPISMKNLLKRSKISIIKLNNPPIYQKFVTTLVNKYK